MNLAEYSGEKPVAIVVSYTMVHFRTAHHATVANTQGLKLPIHFYSAHACITAKTALPQFRVSELQL